MIGRNVEKKKKRPGPFGQMKHMRENLGMCYRSFRMEELMSEKTDFWGFNRHDKDEACIYLFIYS